MCAFLFYRVSHHEPDRCFPSRTCVLGWRLSVRKPLMFVYVCDGRKTEQRTGKPTEMETRFQGTHTRSLAAYTITVAAVFTRRRTEQLNERVSRSCGCLPFACVGAKCVSLFRWGRPCLVFHVVSFRRSTPRPAAPNPMIHYSYCTCYSCVCYAHVFVLRLCSFCFDPPPLTVCFALFSSCVCGHLFIHICMSIYIICFLCTQI